MMNEGHQVRTFEIQQKEDDDRRRRNVSNDHPSNRKVLIISIIIALTLIGLWLCYSNLGGDQ